MMGFLLATKDLGNNNGKAEIRIISVTITDLDLQSFGQSSDGKAVNDRDKKISGKSSRYLA